VNPDNQPDLDNKSEEEKLPEEAFLVLGGMIFPIESSIFSIGRNLENDLVLNDPTVSRFHAEIRYVDDQFVIVDTNSSSGTFLNNKKITINKLVSGDIIQISHKPIMFILKGSPIFDEGRKNTGELNNFEK